MNTQKTFIENGKCLIQLDIPDENTYVLPNIKWGSAIAFPTVAYWYYKLIRNRVNNSTMQYRLGKSLLEEVAACLLGGHGISAATGNYAFDHMKSKGAFNGQRYSEEQLQAWLSEPIFNGKKHIKYRFAKQKASYLFNTIMKFDGETPPLYSGRELRDWLIEIKGIGLKTASWVARNWLNADDVAILDIHIYRAGILGGFFDESMKIEKDYIAMEQIFVELAQAMEVRASELDALIWFEMQRYPNIEKLLMSRKEAANKSLKRRADKTKPGPYQTSLI